MINRIEQTDIVSVFWDDGEGSQLIDVTVLHVPQDVGDMWYFKARDGKIYCVNPSCHTLNSVVKSPPHTNTLDNAVS